MSRIYNIFGAPMDQKGRKSPYGPHGLWFDPDQTRDKYDYPYSYSAFFLIGDHDTVKDCSADYTDRYRLWDEEKYNKAREAVGSQFRWSAMSLIELDRFVKAYYGDDHVATGLVEWCNASTGYPLWSIHFKKIEKVKVSKGIKARAKALAQQASDAYYAKRYRSWPACAEFLLRRGYDEKEAEALLRSKVMRYADQTFKGKANTRHLAVFFDDPKNQRGIAEILEESD